MKNLILALIISISLISSCISSSFYEQGKNEYKKGHYSKANELLRNELEEHPENIKCRYLYAQSFVGIDDLTNAQIEYGKVIEQAPNSELAKRSSIAIYRIHGYYLKKPIKTIPK